MLRAGVGLVVTALIFAFMARYFDLRDIERMAAHARWGYLALGLAFYLLLYVFRTLRFAIIAPRTPLGVMFCIASLHNFLLRILPMRTGDLSYAFLVRRAGTASLGESVFGLILLRLLDSTAVVTLFASTLALNAALYRGNVRQGILIAVAGAVVGALSVLAFTRLLRWGVSLVGHLARLLRLDRTESLRRLLGKLEQAVQKQQGLSRRALAGAVCLTICAWLTNYAVVWTLMHAVAIDISFPQAVLGSTAATVSAMLPIAGIGSFGPLEAGWTLGFALVGLAPSLAAASSIAFSLATFIYAGAFALGAWLLLPRLRA